MYYNGEQDKSLQLNEQIKHDLLVSQRLSNTTPIPHNECSKDGCYRPSFIQIKDKINLALIIEMYQSFPQKDSFFLTPKSLEPTAYFFNKLAGNATLMQQLKEGATEAAIRKSWEPALSTFKAKRKKYLLYPDFE